MGNSLSGRMSKVVASPMFGSFSFILDCDNIQGGHKYFKFENILLKYFVDGVQQVVMVASPLRIFNRALLWKWLWRYNMEPGAF